MTKMRRQVVSVTALSEFATCETRHMLRGTLGDRWTDRDRARLAAGDKDHERHDRNVRAFGASLIRRLLTLSRNAVLIGAPLTIVGLMLNVFAPQDAHVRFLVHIMSGPGIVGAAVDQAAEVPQRIVVFTALQFLYFLVIVAVVRRVFNR